jgi:hypothetical protein
VSDAFPPSFFDAVREEFGVTDFPSSRPAGGVEERYAAIAIENGRYVVLRTFPEKPEVGVYEIGDDGLVRADSVLGSIADDLKKQSFTQRLMERSELADWLENLAEELRRVVGGSGG